MKYERGSNGPSRKHYLKKPSLIKVKNKLQLHNIRNTPQEVFLGKGVLKKCSKFTGEHPCRSGFFSMGVLQ